MSGTSMACPHVAGGAALLLGEQPSLTPVQVREQLLSFATSNAVAGAQTGSPNKFLYAPDSFGGSPSPAAPSPPAPSSPPAPTSPPAPSPPGSSSWTVVSGDCMQEGDCISSPSYPATYSDNQQCSISVPAGSTASITVEAFSTEGGYDKLNVNGVDCGVMPFGELDPL